MAPVGTVQGGDAAPPTGIAAVALSPAAGSVAAGIDPQTTGAIGTAVPTIDLAAGLGEMNATNVTASSPGSAVTALTAVAGDLGAQGTTTAQADSTDAELVVPAGHLDAAPNAAASDLPLGGTADLAPVGTIAALSVSSVTADIAATLSPTGYAAADGFAGSTQSSEASVSLAAPDPAFAPAPSEPESRRANAKPPPAMEIDPRFPNVLVLSMPKGADNSVTTLQLN